jgi:hypothetical protein
MSTDKFLPRDIALVALDVLANIPEEKTEFKQAVRDFIKKDLAYRSPEMLLNPNIWRLFETTIMHRFIPNPIEPWEKTVVDVYIGKLANKTNISD